MKLFFIFCCFAFCNSNGQTNNYQNLLDTTLSSRPALFVYSKPLKITQLNQDDMWEYVHYFKNRYNENIDTIMLLQIIENTKIVDTTFWTDSELPNSILLNNRDEIVSKKYALQKFKPTNDKIIKSYKKQINRFNTTESIDRNISYFSRPIFDNSKTYAIIEWDNGHSYLGGGGEIILYQLKNEVWGEVGIIINWNY